MAKVPLGVRVQPELTEMIEKEVAEGDKTKADIVAECILSRYNILSTNGDETATPIHVDYIQYLKDQIEKKDERIIELERYLMKWQGR